MKKFPSFSQWKQIFKVLKRGEKISLLVFFSLALVSFLWLTGSFYFNNTKIAPAAGGTYTEGMVGQPRFINPVYGETNDIDRTLLGLIFSGLMTYDGEGKLTKDLAQDYKILSNGKVYEFALKNDVFWHDGKPLTADDIVFTITTIQNPAHKSPLRANWIDVQAEKLSEKSVRFTLKAPYNSFLENLTVKIIPKHIWEGILPENFPLSLYNLQPVGSGPFTFLNLNQTDAGFIKTMRLESNRRYYQTASFIATMEFEFFEKKEDLVKAVNAGRLSAFSLAALDNNQVQVKQQIRQGWLNATEFATYSFSLPRYFAVFFNTQKTSLFADKNMRKAFSYATDKQDLTAKIQAGAGNNPVIIDSPILPNFFEYQKPANTYAFDMDLAKNLLDKTGFKENGSTPLTAGTQAVREKSTTKKPAFQFTAYLKVGSKGTAVTQLQACLAKLDENFKNILAPETGGTYSAITEQAVTEFQKKYLPNLKPTGETGESTRKKLNELCAAPSTNSQPLAFTLTTVNQPQLVEVANQLKHYWESVGATVTIHAVSLTDLKPIIKNRSYDALLYGEALGSQPDFYPFWHSSQRLDPGLNLSSYENKTVDQLLKESRETMDLLLKEQKLEKLQNIIIDDAPALFLYNPDYLYWVSDRVQGIAGGKIIDPAKRFIDATHWYIKTKRVWK
ncbi:MAG: hypothetical protein A3C50_02765 [Candidatus Staskawiczbacteria bacterium RIFCSPHIGHO2_02_FULL_43_16]|uniref:Solute-binding protein family 5 domain-containing protein n=1 Tax=Candidatus Staskawiczbacteria bacterium RIFCSPHIGHO2_01_FULL_41_41 TaxID=1802203 RepID=A0A1G2HTJ0_9BACT|nr:MAG: hypothetical protein A2822_03385 [Candidatus Staskawiczbacteria bacterium RIFCSPHIGHO2_01_FULL_41_41]OGZ68202.1 MAG: hypothetical protein A3C50_02765 [Candidatus Staskawiczbacteria bacterium RIFCSPHIGHO2_02_FULL_43_16]OGZ74991.1 MAG: hypothetical protein A3A12_04165 [Candidatus Staskawiczbacteria bacterium RIFCSPLOWO2_01_FULL_43_17b]